MESPSFAFIPCEDVLNFIDETHLKPTSLRHPLHCPIHASLKRLPLHAPLPNPGPLPFQVRLVMLHRRGLLV